ncbi:hypothetical protein [Candidatus Gromoviella agglomerans]|uniref:hypothetical protein n=1 Tax=Candidatus Gromoviella agglomerans TaxID=2806609 RepID=UPI001E51D176|nr:hypothetical protein [Candidatus Gromoviella agglomerans]UFX98423.1 F0F1 ATP synthase subunit B' domain-containing protein [Candidatus Gromoviella agglomerans]
MIYFDYISSQIFWIIVTFSVMFWYVKAFLLHRMDSIFMFRDKKVEAMDAKISDLKMKLQMVYQENEKLMCLRKKELDQVVQKLRGEKEHFMRSEKLKMDQELKDFLCSRSIQSVSCDHELIVEEFSEKIVLSCKGDVK